MKTLPSLRTIQGVGRQRRALRMTIVFHPDTTRIGQFVDLAVWSSDTVRPRLNCTVGRYTPDFSDGRPIDQPHVSRQALVVSGDRGALLLSAAAPGVVCRIGKDEADQLRLGDEQLAAGIPVRLGHGVVLFVRELDLPTAGHGLPEAAFPGCSVEAQRVRQQLAAAAATDMPVLILGESGVGKELIARAIHQHSVRHRRPMVAINMTVIPETLAPAQLFGTAKGAFTGAQASEGFFQQAHGGTLFLDEVGDTPVSIQVQLLRALQEREAPVVGGAPQAVDIRVVAATDGSVEEASGFRNALKQRLAGLTIRVPPLRARREDIGPQVLHMLGVASAAGDCPPLVEQLEDDRAAAWWGRIFFDFLSGDWPGNSRELDNAVRRALLLAGEPWHYESAAAGIGSTPEPVSDAELEATYERCGFEPSATRAVLGMSQGTVYRRLRAHPRCQIACDITDEQLAAAVAVVGKDPAAIARHLRVSLPGLLKRFPQLKD